MRIEIVTDASCFLKVREKWDELWGRSDAHIFQRHDWISGWFSAVQDRKDVRIQIALAWDGGRLCAVMPCAVHRRAGLRVLMWSAQLFSDYCDCIVDRDYEPAAVLSLLWNEMRRFGGFDLISLQQIRPDARCRDLFEDLVRSGHQLQTGERAERCMRIENQWKSGEAFFRSLNKKARNNHTRGKRILAELGGEVSFRVVESSEGGIAEIDEIMRLKEIWLRANDPTSPLLGGDRAVLRAILQSAWRSGLGKMFFLECGGTIAAASFNFVYAGRMEAYFTAYDDAFDRASPGTILIVDYARWSFDRGLSQVDFLRGEEAFKFRMANAETTLRSFTGARTLMGQVAVSGHRWLSRRRQRPDVATAVEEMEVAG